MTVAAGVTGHAVAPERVAAVRRFNRFYTRLVGALGEGHLDSPYSLTEARVRFELGNRVGPTATEIGRELDLDPGYLSRLLRGLEERGLVERAPSALDARQSHLRLTSEGRAAFALLDQRAARDVAGMLARLGELEQRRLLAALGSVETLLGGASVASAAPYSLRPH